MRRRSTLCVAPGCSRLSTRAGEHALPESLVRALRDAIWSPGPFKAEAGKAGATQVVAQSTDVAWAHTPACREHNGDLDVAFERVGQAAIKRLIGVESVKDTSDKTIAYVVHDLDAVTPLTAFETEAAARWLVKTTLMLQHVSTDWEMNGARIDGFTRTGEFPEAAYRELFAGRLIDGFSVWMAVSDFAAPTAVAGDLPAPRLWFGATGGVEGAVATWGLGIRHGDDGRCLHIQVVWHPNIAIVHPDEETGLAVRVWPRPQPGLRLTDLPVLDALHTEAFKRTFATGGGTFDPGHNATLIVAEGLLFTFFKTCQDHHHLSWVDGEDLARVNAASSFLTARGDLVPRELSKN